MLSLGQMVQHAAKMDIIVGKILHELKRDSEALKDPAVALAKATAALEQLQHELERMQD